MLIIYKLPEVHRSIKYLTKLIAMSEMNSQVPSPISPLKRKSVLQHFICKQRWALLSVHYLQMLEIIVSN